MKWDLTNFCLLWYPYPFIGISEFTPSQSFPVSVANDVRLTLQAKENTTQAQKYGIKNANNYIPTW